MLSIPESPDFLENCSLPKRNALEQWFTLEDKEQAVGN